MGTGDQIKSSENADEASPSNDRSHRDVFAVSKGVCDLYTHVHKKNTHTPRMRAYIMHIYINTGTFINDSLFGIYGACHAHTCNRCVRFKMVRTSNNKNALPQLATPRL